MSRMGLTRASVVAAALLLMGCEPPPPPRPAEAPARSWVPVAAWSGRGNRQSETFTMLRHEWRLTWDARAEADAPDPSLRVTVHSADSGRVLAVPLDHRGTGAGVVELVQEPRQFYLTVESTGLEWSLAVEDSGP